MKPLLEMSSPPIDRDQVKTLFGPIGDLMAHHELFYTALTQKTMNWGPKELVGSVFMTVGSAFCAHAQVSAAILRLKYARDNSFFVRGI